MFETPTDKIRLSRLDALYGAVDTSSFILPEKFNIKGLYGLNEKIWLEGEIEGVPAILNFHMYTRSMVLQPVNASHKDAQIFDAKVVDQGFQFILLSWLIEFKT